MTGRFGRRFHVSARCTAGSHPVGFGLRLFLWRQAAPAPPWLVNLDVLLGPFDVQVGIHGRRRAPVAGPKVAFEVDASPMVRDLERMQAQIDSVMRIDRAFLRGSPVARAGEALRASDEAIRESVDRQVRENVGLVDAAREAGERGDHALAEALAFQALPREVVEAARADRQEDDGVEWCEVKPITIEGVWDDQPSDVPRHHDDPGDDGPPCPTCGSAWHSAAMHSDARLEWERHWRWEGELPPEGYCDDCAAGRPIRIEQNGSVSHVWEEPAGTCNETACKAPRCGLCCGKVDENGHGRRLNPGTCSECGGQT